MGRSRPDSKLSLLEQRRRTRSPEGKKPRCSNAWFFQALLQRSACSERRRAGSEDHQRPVWPTGEFRHGPNSRYGITCSLREGCTYLQQIPRKRFAQRIDKLRSREPLIAQGLHINLPIERRELGFLQEGDTRHERVLQNCNDCGDLTVLWHRGDRVPPAGSSWWWDVRRLLLESFRTVSTRIA